MKIISKLLKKIDVFGVLNQLTINNSSKYKSDLGGIFTIIMFSLGLTLFFYFGKEMYYLQNPSSSRSEVYEKDPEPMIFTKETSFFMFGIENINGTHFMDSSIYYASIDQEIFNSSGHYLVSIPLESCQNYNLPSNPDLANYFITAVKVDVSNLYCMKDEFFRNLTISGSFDSEYYINVMLSIYPCKNSTDNNNSCQSSDIINSKLNGFFAFYTIDFVMDPGNYDNPGMATGKDYYGYIMSGNVLKNSRFISNTYVNTDDGWFFSSVKSKKYPTYIYDKENILAGEDSPLVVFKLRKYHTKSIIDRKYKKLQEVLAEEGF